MTQGRVELVGWHHWFNGLEFEQTPGDSEGQGSLACCSPWDCKESDITERLNDNNPEQGQVQRTLCRVLSLSCLTLCDPVDCSPPDFSAHEDSPGKNNGVSCHTLLQGIFATQRSNPGLLHCRWILYHLSYQGSPRILEWVAYPFSRGSSQHRNQTGVSCIASGFFTNYATRKAPREHYLQLKN